MKERAGYLEESREEEKREKGQVRVSPFGRVEALLPRRRSCPCSVITPTISAQTHQFHLNSPAQTPTKGNIKYNENRCLSLSSVLPLARPTPKVDPFGREKVR